MERYVCNLSRDLVSRGWHVDTIFAAMGSEPSLLGWCRDQGVEAVRSSAVLPVTATHPIESMIALRRFIRDIDPAVVNIHYGGGHISLKDLIALRISGRRKIVVTVHHPTEWTASWHSRKKRLLTRSAAFLSNNITTISKATANVLAAAGIPLNRIEIIPIGVRPPVLLLSRLAAREILDWAQDLFVVGCISRLVDHKGLDTLIRAVAMAGDPQWRLVIVGDGPERLRLEQIVETEGLTTQVLWMGYVDDIDVALAAFDVFSLPSRLEGFGLVFVEAAFHGVPSVATNVGGIPDAVIHESTGLLVPVDDPGALRDALLRMTDDKLRRRLGDTAAARPRAEFTESAMGARFEQTFES